MLGLCGNLLRQQPDVPPYHAVVEHGGRVVAAALRTPPHNLILSHIGHPRALTLIAQDVYQQVQTLSGVIGTEAKLFALIWEKITGQIPFLSGRQRIYQLERVNPVTGVSGHLRAATDNDRELLLLWFRGFYMATEDEDEPTREDNERIADRFLKSPDAGMCVWEVDGQAVSMAGYASPTPNGIRISGVYTPPEHRRSGYASACVAALSQVLLRRGYRFCFLYTDLNNPTSNHIYQEIGYTSVCDVEVYEFI